MPMLTTWRSGRARVGARAHRSAKASIASSTRVHLGRERRRPGGARKRGVQHRAAFGEVDRLAREHRVAPRLDAALAREVGEEAQGRGVEQVLRQVAEDLGRLEREAREAGRVAGEGLAQVELAAVRLEVAAQGGPGGGGVATGKGLFHRVSARRCAGPLLTWWRPTGPSAGPGRILVPPASGRDRRRAGTGR